MLAQALDDSIGPRLTGSPGIKAGNDWLVATYTRWGIGAENVQYGTWKGWKRGASHIDLVAPTRPLARGDDPGVEPRHQGQAGRGAGHDPSRRRRLGGVRHRGQVGEGRVRADQRAGTRPAGPTRATRSRRCRTEFDRMVKERTDYRARVGGPREADRPDQQDAATGAGGGGRQGRADQQLVAGLGRVPGLRRQDDAGAGRGAELRGLRAGVSAWRSSNQGPVLRVTAESQDLGEVPVFNTIATIPGTDRADEYVVLSAHFDSWDGSSGATDNGTGTVTMMEAMRILQGGPPAGPAGPSWWGTGAARSRGSTARAPSWPTIPKVVEGLQALFNQDNGTGRVVNVGGAGLLDASGFLADWFSKVPTEITGNFKTFGMPGSPAGGGSDNASFTCYGAPGFGLGSLPWEYFSYTWHTNRDTYDKLVLSEVRNNATLTAMLATRPRRIRTRCRACAGSCRSTRAPASRPPGPSARRAARSFAEYTALVHRLASQVDSKTRRPRGDASSC